MSGGAGSLPEQVGQWIQRLEQCSALPAGLLARRQRHRQGILRVVLTGEAKAGKSTLVNALLKCTYPPLLPVGVLQCSNAVVEVVNARFKELEVEFADGEIKSFRASFEDRLRKLAAVDRRYADLPTVLIDDWLVHARTGAQPPISDWVEGDELQQLVRSYIAQRSFASIPLRITCKLPMKDWARLQLVDTPGLNARGQLSKAGEKEWARADVILAMHSAELAIEAKSLSTLLESAHRVCPHGVLLLLTKCNSRPGLELEEKIVEAKKLYGRLVTDVIAVDAMDRCVSNDLICSHSVDELLEHYNKRSRLVEQQMKSKRLNALMRRQRNTDVKKLRQVLEENSHMEELAEALRQRLNPTTLAELLLQDGLEHCRQRREFYQRVLPLELPEQQVEQLEAELAQLSRELTAVRKNGEHVLDVLLRCNSAIAKVGKILRAAELWQDAPSLCRIDVASISRMLASSSNQAAQERVEACLAAAKEELTRFRQLFEVSSRQQQAQQLAEMEKEGEEFSRMLEGESG